MARLQIEVQSHIEIEMPQALKTGHIASKVNHPEEEWLPHK
jgi:hypothetical protein